MASSQSTPSPFGHLLRCFRRAAGLTQEALAARAGLSLRGVSDLERGINRAPRRETVHLLADALQLGPQDRTAFEAAARTRVSPSVASPSPSSPVALGIAVSIPAFVGRQHEMARIVRHLAATAATGSGATTSGVPLMLVAGEPGIGKSRLLAEAARQGSGAGWQVLAGGCTRRSGQEPYAPFVEMLARCLVPLSLTEQRRTLQGCAWLVRLLPELLETAVVPAPSWKLPPEQERRLVFAAVARFLANMAGPAGTLLLLDDLHWAGGDALDLLTVLVRAESERPLCVVGAYRSTEVRAADPLAMLLADLAREGLASELAVGPLAAPEAAALLASLLEGSEEIAAAVAEQVLERSEGVPFFLVSCAQGLRAGTLGEGAAGPGISWNVAQTIRQRVAALPEVAQELLGAAAVIGRQAPRAILLAVMARGSGWGHREWLEAVEHACQAGLLVEVGAEAYEFAHDLIREEVGASLTTARRALLHQQVAEVLEAVPGEPAVEVLAYHYAQSGNREKMICYLERAGDRASAQYANAEAEGYYRELVAQVEALGRIAEAARAREKLGVVLSIMARYDEALEALERAAQMYDAVGDLEGQGRVTAQIGRVHAFRGTPEEGLARLQPLLEPLAQRGLSACGQAALYVGLAYLYAFTSRDSESLAAADRAVHLARAAADDHLLARALMRRGSALCVLGRLDEGCQVLEEEAIPLLTALGDLSVLAAAVSNVADGYLRKGEMEKSRAFAERAVEIGEQVGDPLWTWVERGHTAFARGDWKQARVDFEQAAVRARQVGTVRGAPYALIFLGQLDLAQGKLDAAFPSLQEGIALADRNRDPQAFESAQRTLAEHDLLEGHPQAACSRLEPVLEGSDRENSHATDVLPLMAWTALDLGDQALAASVVTQAIAHARGEVDRLVLVDALRVQAMLAMRQSRWQDAEAALAEALTLARAMPYPYAEAKSLYVYGQLYAAQGEPVQAREQYEAALAICGRLGEDLYRPHIERALAALGLAPSHE
jgi:tetratricopeptide (TPR) repeat protein